MLKANVQPGWKLVLACLGLSIFLHSLAKTSLRMQGYYEPGVKTDQQSLFEREWDGCRSHASLVLLLQRLERKQKIEGSKK